MFYSKTTAFVPSMKIFDWIYVENNQKKNFV